MNNNQSKASTSAKNKYNAKAYDSLRILFKKGSKSVIQSIAEQQGESINGYVKKAVKAKYKADTGNDIEL